MMLPVGIDHFLAEYTPAFFVSVNYPGLRDFLWPIMLRHVSLVLPCAHWYLVWALLALEQLEFFH
jgi:hypothetical protein